MHPYKVKIFKEIIGDRTLTKFAEEADVSVGNLSRITKGQNASLETIKKIADASRNNIDYDRLVRLFGFKGDTPLNRKQYNNLVDFLESENKLNPSFNEEISSKTGISLGSIFHWQFDDVSPTMEDIVCIADCLDIPYEYIIGEEGKKSKRPTREAKLLSIPIIGTIRAGTPIMSDGNIEGYLDLGSELSADFALNITGDSMSWAGIHSGDIALLVSTQEPQNGAIVAAGKADGDWSATLKYYISNNGAPHLRAANPDYEDIHMDESWTIVGTVTHIIKKAPDLNEYQELIALKNKHDSEWNGVIETATEFGLDADSVKGFISGMHMMIKAARK